jgi:hypothetical protein
MASPAVRRSEPLHPLTLDLAPAARTRPRVFVECRLTLLDCARARLCITRSDHFAGGNHASPRRARPAHRLGADRARPQIQAMGAVGLKGVPEIAIIGNI